MIAAHAQTLARRGKGKAVAMQNAADALARLSQTSADNKAMIVAAGAHKGLVALLGGNSADGKASAAEALRSLSRNDAVTRAIVAEGAVSPLVALARDGSDGAKASAAGALCNISGCDHVGNRIEIVAAGGIDVLISLARDGGLGAKNALHALGNLAVEIAEAGGIDVLISLARDGGRGAEGAAIALCNLATKNVENRIKIAEAGGIEVLVTQLVALARDGSDGTKTKAARDLRDISRDSDENVIKVVQAGGIEVLVALARDGGDGAKELAAHALWEISRDKSENAVKIVQAGGIDVLIALARDGGDGDGGKLVRACAAAVLKDLSCDDEAKVALVVADVIPLLLDIARNGRGMETESIKTALWRLGVDVDKSDLSNAEIRGIPLLFKLSRDGSASIKKQAEDALRTLMVNDEYESAIDLSKAEAELKVADAAVDEARSRRDDRVRESAKAASLRNDAEAALKRAEAAAAEARLLRDDWLRTQKRRAPGEGRRARAPAREEAADGSRDLRHLPRRAALHGPLSMRARLPLRRVRRHARIVPDLLRGRRQPGRDHPLLEPKRHYPRLPPPRRRR